jgi:hypothetical protein
MWTRLTTCASISKEVAMFWKKLSIYPEMPQVCGGGYATGGMVLPVSVVDTDGDEIHSFVEAMLFR